jgi:hypothetical protein
MGLGGTSTRRPKRHHDPAPPTSHIVWQRSPNSPDAHGNGRQRNGAAAPSRQPPQDCYSTQKPDPKLASPGLQPLAGTSWEASRSVIDSAIAPQARSISLSVGSIVGSSCSAAAVCVARSAGLVHAASTLRSSPASADALACPCESIGSSAGKATSQTALVGARETRVKRTLIAFSRVA